MALTYTPGKNAPGAGRPRGSTNKLTIETVLRSIDNTCGRPFSELLAEGYYKAIVDDDRRLRFEYERMFLAKVVADRLDVDVTDTADIVQAKQAAFAEAIAHLSQLAKPALPAADLVIDQD
jgi:hypothetical protein